MILTGTLPAFFDNVAATGLQVDRDLAAEAATDLQRGHANLRLVHLHYCRDLLPNGERALSACPDPEATVFIPNGGSVVGLDVALVDHFEAEFALDHMIGFSKRRIRVAKLMRKLFHVVGVPALFRAG